MRGLGILAAIVLALALAPPADSQWQSISVNSILPAVPTQAITLGSPSNPSAISIDPVSGIPTISSPVLNSPTLIGPAVITGAATATSLQLGTGLTVSGNDLVLTAALPTLAPVGPGKGGITLRPRPGKAPGTCSFFVASGTAWGEFPVAFVGPLGQILTQLPGGLGC